MIALLGALLAGVLTTLAPCVLPLLPVIVGGSLSGGGRLTGRRRALVVTASLGASVAVFTLLLKAGTAFIGLPTDVLRWLSGSLLVALGLVSVFPGWWEAISGRLQLQSRTTGTLARAGRGNGIGSAVLTGAALGPVFSSCSPLYGYVVVTVLPATPAWGLALLVAYVVGLCGALLAISLAGLRLTARLGWAADPASWLRRGLGVAFVLVGVMVVTGADQDLQAWIITNSPVAPWALDSILIPE